MLSSGIARVARERHGLVLASELGSSPHRAAARAGLVLVQPGVFAAATQPVGFEAQVEAARLGEVRDGWAFQGQTALWIQGAAPEPDAPEVGLPLTWRPRLLPPVESRRVAPATLLGVVERGGYPVVPLETALVQVLADQSIRASEVLVERLLRERRTTSARLRGARRQGLAGSAALGAVLAEVAADGAERQQRRLVRALRAAGLTGLRTEVPLVSASGTTAYLDGLHEPSMRALEVDGASHDLAAQRMVDRRRDRWVLQQFGIETIRVWVAEVDRDLRRLVAELMPMFLDPSTPASRRSA